jgi:hypothetical protein
MLDATDTPKTSKLAYKPIRSRKPTARRTKTLGAEPGLSQAAFHDAEADEKGDRFGLVSDRVAVP